jgi:DNA repair photolyase
VAESSPIHGRGAASNPANRFEAIHLEPDPDLAPEDALPCPTRFFRDRSVTILSRNESPDIGFQYGLNPYRGCEHGCIYCFARPMHEYLGFSAGLDFESKILVKENAPELLEQELTATSWNPQPIALCSATDPYQPAERQFKLTRRCLEVLARFRNPVMIITKNHLVTRDIDLLSELARHQAVAVCLSITTLDANLARKLEPRTASPRQRLDAIHLLAGARIPVGVLVAPVIPGLTDPEMLGILDATAQAGARYAGYEVLRLPHGVKDLFQEWLAIHEPLKQEKILGRIRSIRSGELNDSRFKTRMRGEGLYADQIARTFEIGCRKSGLTDDFPTLSAHAFRRPGGSQMELGLGIKLG